MHYIFNKVFNKLGNSTLTLLSLSGVYAAVTFLYGNSLNMANELLKEYRSEKMYNSLTLLGKYVEKEYNWGEINNINDMKKRFEKIAINHYNNLLSLDKETRERAEQVEESRRYLVQYWNNVRIATTPSHGLWERPFKYSPKGVIFNLLIGKNYFRLHLFYIIVEPLHYGKNATLPDFILHPSGILDRGIENNIYEFYKRYTPSSWYLLNNLEAKVFKENFYSTVRNGGMIHGIKVESLKNKIEKKI